MRRSQLAMLVVMAAVGCTSVPPPASSGTASGSAVPATPTGPAASGAVQTVLATPAATVATSPPTVVPTPSPTASAVEPSPTVIPVAPTATVTSADPPAAAMSVQGDAAVLQGRLGSYSYNQFASDAPWLPARILPLVKARKGATLIVRFPDGTSIAGWSAVYAAATDESGVVLHTLSVSVEGADEIPEVSLMLPPVGDWVLAVGLGYPANLGTGYYYWRVRVAPP
jgi:hypothetical protein